MSLFLAAALLVQADPRDRLQEAVRETAPAEVQAALVDLLRGPPGRSARALAAALPKARERLNLLLAATVGSRRAYDEIDTSLEFNINEDRLKKLRLDTARDRIKEAAKRAGDGEKVYDFLLVAFGSIPREGAVTVAAEVERTGSWLLKCELLEGLGAMGADEELLAAAAREKEPVVVAAAVAGLRSAQGLPYLTHPQWQVRIAALQGPGRAKGAVKAVVDAASGADARFRNAACAWLSRHTGTPLPADPAAWRDWYRANGEDFEAGNYLPSAAKVPDGPGRTTFYDVPVCSTRVCVVVDRSRSMKADHRFVAACAELRRLLDRLPDGSIVNLVFFGGTTSCFSTTNRVLDADARRDAAAFIERQNLESSTDLYAALEKALTFVGSPETGKLREDGIDTIIVLSDGEATTGRIVDDDLVSRVVSRRARFLRPAIHAVSLGADAPALKRLALATGGEFRVR